MRWIASGGKGSKVVIISAVRSGSAQAALLGAKI